MGLLVATEESVPVRLASLRTAALNLLGQDGCPPIHDGLPAVCNPITALLTPTQPGSTGQACSSLCARPDAAGNPLGNKTAKRLIKLTLLMQFQQNNSSFPALGLHGTEH